MKNPEVAFNSPLYIVTKCFLWSLQLHAGFSGPSHTIPDSPEPPVPSSQIGKQLFHVCIPRTWELCLECFLPPVLMGSLPSIIYGAYQITLASQPSPNNWKCGRRSLSAPLRHCHAFGRTENSAYKGKRACPTHFTVFCVCCSNLCILYDLNAVP